MPDIDSQQPRMYTDAEIRQIVREEIARRAMPRHCLQCHAPVWGELKFCSVDCRLAHTFSHRQTTDAA